MVVAEPGFDLREESLPPLSNYWAPCPAPPQYRLLIVMLYSHEFSVRD